MQNPLTNKIQHLLFYFLMWTVISTVHILFIQKSYTLEWSFAITDGLIFNFSFAILSLGLWYVVKYSLWDEKDLGQVFWRIDVIGIAMPRGKQPIIEHIEDALGW